MSIYDPLNHHLNALQSDVWSASFADVERIIRRNLPKSAYTHRPWWANQKADGHSQARAWQDAGWETCDVDLGHRTVRFERRKQSHGERSVSSDLWTKAAKLTGIQDRTELAELALVALIQQEAARRLGALGGTMPGFVAPDRERPLA